MTSLPRPLKRALRAAKRVADPRVGTLIDELYWRSRSRKWAEACLSPESLTHPHRRLLLDTIAAYVPFQSALEIGCASGPNLHLLSQRFPQTMLYGVDINKRALNTGRAWFRRQHCENVSLAISKANNLALFTDNSIDIVFTDALLIYIGPDKVESVVREMLRIARRALILHEWHTDSAGPSYDDHWIYNWRLVLGRFVREKDIVLTKLPPQAWKGDWAKYGYIIEAKLCS